MKRGLRIIAVTLAIAAPVAGLVFALYLFEVLPIADLSARPAVTYETPGDLADALNTGGVDCDFEEQEPGRKVASGFCRDPEATAGAGLFLRIFDNDETHDSFVRNHVRCGYDDAVVGERWMVIVDGKAEAAAVLEAVGGRVVEGDVC